MSEKHRPIFLERRWMMPFRAFAYAKLRLHATLVGVGVGLSIAYGLNDMRHWIVVLNQIAWPLIVAIWAYRWGAGVEWAAREDIVSVIQGACPGCFKMKPRPHSIVDEVAQSDDECRVSGWDVCDECYTRYLNEQDNDPSRPNHYDIIGK